MNETMYNKIWNFVQKNIVQAQEDKSPMTFYEMLFAEHIIDVPKDVDTDREIIQCIVSAIRMKGR